MVEGAVIQNAQLQVVFEQRLEASAEEPQEGSSVGGSEHGNSR